MMDLWDITCLSGRSEENELWLTEYKGEETFRKWTAKAIKKKI